MNVLNLECLLKHVKEYIHEIFLKNSALIYLDFIIEINISRIKTGNIFHNMVLEFWSRKEINENE